MKGRTLLGVFSAIGIGLLGADIAYTDYQVNPKGVTTVRDFLARMPAPQSICLMEKQGTSYFCVTGALPGFPSNPSGAPMYYFNEQGHLVHWVRDAGDAGGDAWAQWGGGSVVVCGSLDEIEKRLKQRN